jgi:Fic family protein
MKFLDGLDNDLRRALLAQLRDLWTHNSTALEGNTLTLGETSFVLAEGLTVSGKSLREHQEISGHAFAIELLYSLLNRDTQITESDLFELHRAIQTSAVVDIYQPIGAWKREPNGTHALTIDSKPTFIDYSTPADVPILMAEWLLLLNKMLVTTLNEKEALLAYSKLHLSFVRIHPFADGNGRMARLIANIPILKSGFPPILIDKNKRRDYLIALSMYDIEVGCAKKGALLLPESKLKDNFDKFCRECWDTSLNLVNNIWENQKKRNSNNHSN